MNFIIRFPGTYIIYIYIHHISGKSEWTCFAIGYHFIACQRSRFLCAFSSREKLANKPPDVSRKKSHSCCFVYKEYIFLCSLYLKEISDLWTARLKKWETFGQIIVKTAAGMKQTKNKKKKKRRKPQYISVCHDYHCERLWSWTKFRLIKNWFGWNYSSFKEILHKLRTTFKLYASQ